MSKAAQGRVCTGVIGRICSNDVLAINWSQLHERCHHKTYTVRKAADSTLFKITFKITIPY